MVLRLLRASLNSILAPTHARPKYFGISAAPFEIALVRRTAHSILVPALKLRHIVYGKIYDSMVFHPFFRTGVKNHIPIADIIDMAVTIKICYAHRRRICNRSICLLYGCAATGNRRLLHVSLRRKVEQRRHSANRMCLSIQHTPFRCSFHQQSAVRAVKVVIAHGIDRIRLQRKSYCIQLLLRLRLRDDLRAYSIEYPYQFTRLHRGKTDPQLLCVCCC